jgi:hypothetical protein
VVIEKGPATAPRRVDAGTGGLARTGPPALVLALMAAGLLLVGASMVSATRRAERHARLGGRVRPPSPSRRPTMRGTLVVGLLLLVVPPVAWWLTSPPDTVGVDPTAEARPAPAPTSERSSPAWSWGGDAEVPPSRMRRLTRRSLTPVPCPPVAAGTPWSGLPGCRSTCTSVVRSRPGPRDAPARPRRLRRAMVDGPGALGLDGGLASIARTGRGEPVMSTVNTPAAVAEATRSSHWSADRALPRPAPACPGRFRRARGGPRCGRRGRQRRGVARDLARLTAGVDRVQRPARRCRPARVLAGTELVRTDHAGCGRGPHRRRRDPAR